jgi:predicted kinase
MAEDLMDKVFSFFSGDSNETDDRKILLKQTLKELSQNKYVKFFRPKTDEADPSLAVFLYNIYKITFSIRTFMQNEEKMGRLKQTILEAFMDNAILETVKRLNPAFVEERARKTPPAELTTQIQTDISRLSSAFDNTRISGADRCYNMVAALAQVVNFNYPAFLKKFDANFLAGNFSTDPKFSAIRVDIIAKELGEFLVVSHSLNPEGDWKAVLDLLKSCAGQAFVQPELFITMVNNLREVHQSKILELMVQYGLKNPVWQWKPRTPDEHIGEAWLAARQAEARESIEKITSAQKHSQINVLIKQIFESNDLERMENYTMAKGEVLRKRDLEDFRYAEGLNYLRIFLEDYLEKEFRELCDILLIRGQWTNNTMSKEMSEALHQLLEASPPITQLDAVLAEDGGDGSRLKAAILRVDRDKTQARYINSIVDNNNEAALEMINSAAQNFIVIGKHLKSLIDDVQKKHPELLINWRELNLVSKSPLPQRMADDYKKINYFVQLMRLCTA